MPEKFFCCLPLNFGYAVTGLFSISLLGAGIILTIYSVRTPGLIQVNVQGQQVTAPQFLGIGILLIIGNAIPTLTFIASLFVKGVYYMYSYANAFLFFPLLVESYILAIDIRSYVFFRNQMLLMAANN